jgi:hypothetical protein
MYAHINKRKKKIQTITSFLTAVLGKAGSRATNMWLFMHQKEGDSRKELCQLHCFYEAISEVQL